MAKKTIEEKVTGTILQRTEKFKIGGKTYKVAPPSVATLIMISEAVAKLPKYTADKENPIQSALAIAEGCRPIGEIVAIYILGAKAAEEPARISRLPRFLRSFFKIHHTTAKDKLAAELLETVAPSELQIITAKMIQGMELVDFFAITTFLNEINLLRPTKVETEATQYGQ